MTSDSHLRYLDAARVDTPMGSLGAMHLITPSDKNVGTLDGVIVDPIERKVRFFVVTLRRWWATRQYLLPFMPAQIDSERQGLHVELEPDELKRLPRLHANTFPPFSDDDLVAFLFSPRVA